MAEWTFEKQNCLKVHAGAYEPPKEAKEHATYAVLRVPSQSKLKLIIIWLVSLYGK